MLLILIIIPVWCKEKNLFLTSQLHCIYWQHRSTFYCCQYRSLLLAHSRMVFTFFFEQESTEDESLLLQLCQCFRLFSLSGHRTQGVHRGIIRSDAFCYRHHLENRVGKQLIFLNQYSQIFLFKSDFFYINQIVLNFVLTYLKQNFS